MKWKLAPLALAVCVAAPSFSHALELKEVHARYGPFGALRKSSQFLPGDYLFITYYIDGISVDDKNGKAVYEQEIELQDVAKKKVIFRKKTPNEVVPKLGGGRLPGVMQVIMGPNQEPGKYVAKLLVTDKRTSKSTTYEYPFEIMKKAFGIVGVTAQAVAFPGQTYAPGFALVNLNLDAKGKPHVDIAMRILDATGKTEITKMTTSLPKELPNSLDLKQENFVPVQFPVYLNRPGEFMVDIEAVDTGTKQRVHLRFPFTVLDPNKFGK